MKVQEKNQTTLPPTNMAPVGRYLEDGFLLKGPPLSCHVSGREGSEKMDT